MSWPGLRAGTGWDLAGREMATLLGRNSGLGLRQGRRSWKLKAEGSAHPHSPGSQRCLWGTLGIDRISPDGEF